MSSRFRLAAVTSHVIPYRAPLFRRLAAEPWLELEVLYCHDYGVRPQDSAWGLRNFTWEGDFTAGYRSRLLRNVSPRPKVSTLGGEINPELVSILFGGRYDAVIFEGWHTVTALAGLLLGNVSPTPILLQCEATLSTQPRSALRALAKPLAMRALLRAPAAFLALGTKNRAFYAHHGVGEERIFPFPYTVDVAWFTAEAERLAEERRRLRADLGFSDRETLFLFVGQMLPRKDPLGLVAAYKALRAQRDDVGLVMVGSGPELDRVRAAADGVPGARIEGFKNVSALPLYYALADVFVLPSFEETWGLVVNEAMCFGLPVISTWTMGSTFDLVDGRDTGIVVNAGKTDELHAAMTALAADPDRRRQMGARARATIGQWTYEEDAAGLRAAAEWLKRAARKG